MMYYLSLPVSSTDRGTLQVFVSGEEEKAQNRDFFSGSADYQRLRTSSISLFFHESCTHISDGIPFFFK